MKTAVIRFQYRLGARSFHSQQDNERKQSVDFRVKRQFLIIMITLLCLYIEEEEQYSRVARFPRTLRGNLIAKNDGKGF